MSGYMPLVAVTPSGIEVKARRRAGASNGKPIEGVLNEILTTMQKSKGQAATVIADFDLSQNKLTYEEWDQVFNTLSEQDIKVLRFRLFGCPTLNNDVMQLFANYLRLIQQDKAPTEMHLSDCAVTGEGFNALMEAIEETDLYPNRSSALYLRMENNYIPAEVIQEKIDSGLIRPLRKSTGSRGSCPSGVKVDMILRDSRDFQQKEGAPPSPENAAAPKDVKDRAAWMPQAGSVAANPWQQGKGASKGAGKGAGKGVVVKGYGKGVATQGHFARAGIGQQVAPPHKAGSGAAVAWQRPAAITRPAGVVAAGVWPRGSVAHDRSRTPMARANVGAPRTIPAKKGLPPGWEEHWSDEYKIPYFWHSETGESMWEKPTK